MYLLQFEFKEAYLGWGTVLYLSGIKKHIIDQAGFSDFDRQGHECRSVNAFHLNKVYRITYVYIIDFSFCISLAVWIIFIIKTHVDKKSNFKTTDGECQ